MLPESMEYVGISELDNIRDNIAKEINEPGLDLWMSISFYRNEKWL
ncbi:hypothetical protein PCI56_26980 [Plesiomonas shigelloides subsp. oncorhynchi]|nr:hypothetical protein [Plesiomonas shigelloides]